MGNTPLNVGRTWERLGAERRACARLEDTLREHPEVRERTAEFLRGAPTLAEMEDSTMNGRPDKPVRVPVEMVEQASELIPHMEKDPAFQQRGLFGGRVTQTAAIRVALSLGLDALRERYGLAGGEING